MKNRWLLTALIAICGLSDFVYAGATSAGNISCVPASKAKSESLAYQFTQMSEQELNAKFDELILTSSRIVKETKYSITYELLDPITKEPVQHVINPKKGFILLPGKDEKGAGTFQILEPDGNNYIQRERTLCTGTCGASCSSAGRGCGACVIFDNDGNGSAEICMPM